eukprot:2249375-Rhodomonas_salina.2
MEPLIHGQLGADVDSVAVDRSELWKPSKPRGCGAVSPGQKGLQPQGAALDRGEPWRVLEQTRTAFAGCSGASNKCK